MRPKNFCLKGIYSLDITLIPLLGKMDKVSAKLAQVDGKAGGRMRLSLLPWAVARARRDRSMCGRRIWLMGTFFKMKESIFTHKIRTPCYQSKNPI